MEVFFFMFFISSFFLFLFYQVLFLFSIRDIPISHHIIDINKINCYSCQLRKNSMSTRYLLFLSLIILLGATGSTVFVFLFPHSSSINTAFPNTEPVVFVEVNAASSAKPERVLPAATRHLQPATLSLGENARFYPYEHLSERTTLIGYSVASILILLGATLVQWRAWRLRLRALRRFAAMGAGIKRLAASFSAIRSLLF
jgi:hypothetical protein